MKPSTGNRRLSMRNLLIALCVLAVVFYDIPLIFAQQNSKAIFKIDSLLESQFSSKPISEYLQEEKQSHAFFDFIDRRIYEEKIKKKEEKKRLRELWQEWLGLDIYYPYFKAREIEDWVGDKLKVDIFNLHGRAKLEDNQAKYIFNIKF